MRMPEAWADEVLAPCGVLCAACDFALREKNRCQGCLSDGPRRGYCNTCARRDCALGQGLTACRQCVAFPCPKLRSLSRSYRQRYGVDLVEEGRIAGEMGARAYLERQRQRYRCGCGGVINLHTRLCSECGRAAESPPEDDRQNTE